MGDWNQLDFARRHRHCFELPALEVGSKDYGNTQDLRALLAPPAASDYIGVDLEAGPGVDIVLDLTADFATIEAALGGRRFRSVFCLSVLEHCAQPFAMADHLSRLLLPGGVAFISVPHIWEIHAYPDDYWRFTADGVKTLFPGLEFRPEEGEIAHARNGLRSPHVEQPGLVWNTFSFHRGRGHWGAALRVALGKLLLGERRLFGNTTLNMIGRKPPVEQHGP